jgi:N-acyl-D-amino-acid deacylase
MNRREFVHGTAFAVGAAVIGGHPSWALEPRWMRGRPKVDIMLRGALVYDGSGSAPVKADVAVAGDRIAAVGPGLPIPAGTTVELDGLALAPGFIDVHSHTDLELLIDPRAESKVRQGVTTEVTGQDGSSIGPWTPEEAAEVQQRYRERYGVELEFHGLAGFFDQLERQGAAVNLASMVGQGSVRGHVIGDDDRPATAEEIERMRALVREAIAAGACGLSSGLEYVPSAFADLQELVALASELAGTGLPYASHMRNEDDQLFGAVLERARADGVDVMYDRYPYVAYSTGLSNLFPVWSRDGGTGAFLSRLEDPEQAGRIEVAVRAKIAQLGSWDAVQVTSTGAEEFAWARGHRLGELAAERRQEPYALLLELIVGTRNRAGMVGFGMSEENTARFLAHPLGMVCSDGSALAVEGPLASGSPHPRSFGTFPRVLGHYCREQRVMPLETAIHKMTALPAARLHLEGRGVILPEAFADLVVFDPDRVADRATFEQPHQYPVGIRHVMVNGRFVLRDGERTEELSGRPLRPAPA